MFQEWGFLISEMLVLIILAALLGLLVGWIIWGRRKGDAEAEARLQAGLDACNEKARICDTNLTRAKADLEACRDEATEKDARIAALEAEVKQAKELAEAAEVAAMEAAAEAVAVAEAVEADHGAHPVHPGGNPEEDAAMTAEWQQEAEAAEAEHHAEREEEAQAGGQDYDGDGVVEGENEGVKPATLTEARDGKPDDLKQIKGIGPGLEKLCNELGF